MAHGAVKTVSILFTDIEGSTRLLQRLGDGYRRVLDDHFDLLFAAIRRAGGSTVNTMGDGLFAVFDVSLQAVEAALASQLSLAAHHWPASGIVRVRMGIHAGEFAADDTEYVSLDVHRAARICASAHGGQVLISAAAAGLCRDNLAGHIVLRDLGQHRLKDLDRPEHLFQVTAHGLLAEFPPPRALNMSPHNLPSDVTEFVGRRSECEAVARLLDTARLLSLIGPGGSGKTRLALQIAREVLPGFEGGVFFVSLASVRDEQFVAPTIARALGVQETDDRGVLEAVVAHLTGRKLLLILDNFEQVLGAAQAVHHLLSHCPELKIMVTSRALLHVSGERVFEVLPLDLPPPGAIDDLDELAASSSVDLFVRRASAVQPGFVLDHDNAAAVAQIVARLDGLPLAIELAAVRIRLFPPKTLAARLHQRFRTLSGELQDATAHHRTLRDAIAWSYDLLGPNEQMVFRRIGIFVGGFTLEAAELVAAGEPSGDVIDAVASLIDKSLLRSGVLHGEARITMLETIREFALEQLQAAGEHEKAAGDHLGFVLGLAEDAEGELTGRGELVAMERLVADLANIRAALDRCLERGEIEIGLRICGAIWRFWHATGHIGEGRLWLGTLLVRTEAVTQARAKALTALAGLAYWQADYAAALAAYRQALVLYRELGDARMEADTLCSMSTTLTWSGDATGGAGLADEALARFEALGLRQDVGEALMAQGFACWMMNDLAGARPLWEKSLAIALETGNKIEAATKKIALASIKFRQGEEGNSLKDAVDALRELFELKHVTYTIMAIDFVAALAAARDPEESVRLAGAASQLRRELGGGMRPEASGLEDARTVASRLLDPDAIERDWARGEAMKLDEAVACALEIGAAVSVFN